MFIYCIYADDGKLLPKRKKIRRNIYDITSDTSLQPTLFSHHFSSELERNELSIIPCIGYLSYLLCERHNKGMPFRAPGERLTRVKGDSRWCHHGSLFLRAKKNAAYSIVCREHSGMQSCNKKIHSFLCSEIEAQEITNACFEI